MPDMLRSYPTNYSIPLHIATLFCFLLPFFYSGCSPSAEEKKKAEEKRVQDSIELAEQLIDSIESSEHLISNLADSSVTQLVLSEDSATDIEVKEEKDTLTSQEQPTGS